MLEIWINGNSMKSLSNHVPVWCKYKEKRQYIWMDFKYARKLEVECWNNDQLPAMMSSRFTSDEMGHNPQAPGRAKKQAHSC